MQQAVETSYEQAGRQASAETDARRWVTLLAAYREPAFGRSLVELTITLAPFLALWGAMLFSLRYSYWLCLLLAVPAAGFLVRLFMIQHDCGHGAFFRRRFANDWLGRVLGVLTLKGSFGCLRLALWDEDKKRLVSFVDARLAAHQGQ